MAELSGRQIGQLAVQVKKEVGDLIERVSGRWLAEGVDLQTVAAACFVAFSIQYDDARSAAVVGAGFTDKMLDQIEASISTKGRGDAH